MSVTMTVCGVFVAPVAVIVNGVVYVPADIPVVLTFRATEPAPVPPATLGVNHDAFSVTVQFRVPAPLLPILRVWTPGLLPPCTAVKERLVALRPMVGVGAAVTDSMTATD
jgi:hypothetical protein